MDILQKQGLTINIAQPANETLKVYLRVFLAHTRLTDRQLDVTTALVSRYAQYVRDGVVEPYASRLLFSTETRKEIVKEVKISAPHMNNTFKALCDKQILSRQSDESYIIDPNLIPCSSLTFNFTVIPDEELGESDQGSSGTVEPTQTDSQRGSDFPTESGAYDDPEEAGEEYIPEEDWVSNARVRPQAADGYENIEPVKPIED